ncbi:MULTISPECIES: Ger(x)C family spore germination protein [unclassified Fredinandcohnia]|uniref:Ger(x)C family spore germination protein n=1 Tax=unclassified Fredinandcohnia TaxID=2837514 RepID=UPI0030FD918D
MGVSKHSWKTCLKIILIALVPGLFLTGCWDSDDIEQRATVLGISIDKVDDADGADLAQITGLGNQFPKPKEGLIRLSAQIAVPGRIPLGPQTGGAGVDQNPLWVISVVGYTLDDTIAVLQQEVADRLFFGHLRTIVISEEVAKDGVKRFNDYLRRNPEIRRTAWMVVSKGEAKKFMEVAPKLERVPTLYLSAMVENAVRLGTFPEDFIGLFWTRLQSKGQDTFLPYLELKKEDNIQISGLAYFKDDRMIGRTEPVEIGLFMAVTGEKRGGYEVFVKVPDTDVKVIVRAEHRRTSIIPTLRNGKPHFVIKIHYESTIAEGAVGIDLNNAEIVRKIEEEATKGVIEGTNRLIKKMQDEQSDIFGFGEYFRAKQPAYWNKKIQTKEKWREVYKDLTFDIHCTTKIRRVGTKAK